MAALPGLPPVEQLIHDQDRDQQHQQPSHGVRRQRVRCPPAPLPGVGEFDDDKRQRNQHRQDGSQPPQPARRHPTTLRELAQVNPLEALPACAGRRPLSGMIFISGVLSRA